MASGAEAFPARVDPAPRAWRDQANVLEAMAQIPISESVRYEPWSRGFRDHFTGEMSTYIANYDLEANTLAGRFEIVDRRFRIDVQM